MKRHGRLELEGEAHARAKRVMQAEFPEVDPDDEFFTGTLEGETNFYEAVSEKVEMYRRCRASAAGLRAQVQAYAEGLLARADREDKKADAIEARLERVLAEIGEHKITDPAYELLMRKPGMPPVDVYDPELLPAEYWRQPTVPEPQPDKIKIREALLDPDRAHEVELAARLNTQQAPKLMIKLK